MLKENQPLTEVLDLPEGYTSRPPALDDIPAAVDLFNLCLLYTSDAADE